MAAVADPNGRGIAYQCGGFWTHHVTNPKGTNGLTYRDAGVDIDEGERLVDLIKPAAKSTARPGAAAALGGQASGTGFNTGGSSVASEGGKIDGMMADAKKLMLSDKKEDQLKGQEMMQNAQNMFNMLSQLIKAQGDMAKAAIQNMR